MNTRLTRRALLSGAATLAATQVWANAPERSLRPVARPQQSAAAPTRLSPVARATAEELIAEAGLGGTVGFVVADARTGAVLEAVDANVPLPPASVTKSVTALYALEALGPDHQFKTRLLAGGPIRDGVLEGDLILAGGGDPNLVTDDLAALASSLAASGLKEVKGAFQVWGGAIPYLAEIEEGQLDHLGYNPAISGLNLNFNRVHFEWARAGGDYRVTLDARSETYRPAVTTARMRVVDRSTPIYTYANGSNVDEWTVARRALGDAGSRWLPVRNPALYAGDVFTTFARSHGIVLKFPNKIAALPPVTTELAQYASAPLRRMMRDMLLYSTNLTAEATGLAATVRRTGQMRGLRTSALGMTRWAHDRSGIAPEFADHSGLSDASHISARDMVQLLTASDVESTLRPILKSIVMLDDERRAIPNYPAQIRAKTGTLNFVSTLAGYIETAGGRHLAFAIFAAEPDARAQSKLKNDEQPAGAAGWNGRAKRLQQTLLQRWGLLYGDGA